MINIGSPCPGQVSAVTTITAPNVRMVQYVTLHARGCRCSGKCCPWKTPANTGDSIASLSVMIPDTLWEELGKPQDTEAYWAELRKRNPPTFPPVPGFSGLKLP